MYNILVLYNKLRKLGESMFLKKNIPEKYTVIIVPHKGSATKNLDISSKLLKKIIYSSVVVLFIVLMTIIFFSYRYINLNKKAIYLQQDDKYIDSLKEDNQQKQELIQEKQEVIDDYNKYKQEIQEKMNTIDELEKDLKSKLNSESSNEDSMSNSKERVALNRGSNYEITKDMEEKIKTLRTLNDQMNELVEKQNYIPSFRPCNGTISSYFGYRSNPFDNSMTKFHAGIDVAAAYGEEIHAAASGTVVEAVYSSSYGNYVLISHGNGIQTRYAHSSKLLVSAGNTVKKGQVIALVGSTGDSTGPHLHFEILKNGEVTNPISVFNNQ
jgi:murein DD-endopeptidase MepM/ murein hydrolase activator NlpD